jgi:hypothetical protein
MTHITIARQIENAEAEKTRAPRKSQKGKTMAFKKPCGHAAPVDSFAIHLANLTTSAWSRQYVWRHHMPTGPTTTVASLKGQGTTARHLPKKGSFE